MYDYGVLLKREEIEVKVFYEFPFITSVFEYQLMTQRREKLTDRGHYLSGTVTRYSLL